MTIACAEDLKLHMLTVIKFNSFSNDEVERFMSDIW